ncbi:MAG: energy-coupling factor ABC transporter ATP-binding protein [Deltaproteobacteria bacterium]
MAALLEMRQVIHRYNGRTVLDIPSFSIATGTITGLVGPNGSGKTTMLRLLSLVDSCTSGTILFRGQPAAPFDDHIRHRISLLLQTPYLLKRPVYDNIAYGLKLRKTTDRLEKRVEAALDLVGLPPSFSKRQWHELSGGESQRVALAARLALQPDCLFLDEPIASVDPQSASIIRRAILFARKEWNTAILVSSHQHPWLRTFCDRIVDLHHGRIPPYPLQNILNGPWHYLDNGNVSKILSDGQIITLPAPPTLHSSAILPPGALTVINGEADFNAGNILRGKIVSVQVDDERDDRLNLHILCAEQKFILELSLDDWRARHLQPGQFVPIAVSLPGVVWMPA